MARTTDALVGGVIEVDSNIPLTPFISAANSLVTSQCTDSDYTDAELLEIETWLAAHFYAIRDKPVASEQAKGVNQSFQYKVGLFLQQTRHGQMALVLDYAGNLAALSKRLEEGEPSEASVTWLGTDYDTQD